MTSYEKCQKFDLIDSITRRKSTTNANTSFIISPESKALRQDYVEGRDLESYHLTEEFFNNIPDVEDDDSVVFTLQRRYAASSSEKDDEEDIGWNSKSSSTSTSTTGSSDLRSCDNFIQRKVRPKDYSSNNLKLKSIIDHLGSMQSRPKRQKTSVKSKKKLDVKGFARLLAIYTLSFARRKSATDASSSNEAVHLQQRLKSLSTELVTLRNRLHVDQGGTGGNAAPCEGVGSVPMAAGLHLNASTPNLNSAGGNNGNNTSNTNTCGRNSGAITQQKHHGSAILAGNLSADNGNANGINLNHKPNNINTLPNNAQQHNNISKTLPHNPTTTSRNTSIPHPLPHEKSMGSGSACQFKVLPSTALIHTSNTLPLRSSSNQNHMQTQHHHQHTYNPQKQQYMPFLATLPKYINPCHGIKTLPFGGTPTASFDHVNNTNNYQNSPHTHELDDLIHLHTPLTEDAVMRTLQARFAENRYFTNIGPILLSINPYLDVGNSLTLSSTRSLPLAQQLRKIVQEAVRQQAETGYPQAIILSGTSGSGKTHCSMVLLRQLFAVAGGGPETDAFKHLAAAFTVLRSLGSAKTQTNSESSRIGQFIEVQVTDGALYRTKIHCYFLDQTRVIRPLPKEKNYHIFYQMLAGLSSEERSKLNLEGYSAANLRYLQSGDIAQNDQEDAARFLSWKTCLGILGIPFFDVVRVLAAVLLLGNVQFIDGQHICLQREVEVKGESELNSVASLLGLPPAALFRGLTTRTHNARGQLVKSVCDANMSNMTRDCLAKALYCRTVATIVRRANSLKRLGSTLGTLSSDSNDSVHNQADVASQHASTVGGNSGSKSMTALNNAVRHATDGFIGILDMFGFEEPSPHAQLEHLCINLCAETMQHFYNTHIFKSSVESCRDEGIACDEVDYVDNVPCIDLISSLRTGLLSMLDAECSVRGTAESYVAKIKVQHRNSSRLEMKHTSDPHDPRMFMIRHFAGRVEYDTTDFLDTNRDVVPDDLVAVFYKHTCNFGFATHLFGSELKALYALQNVPRGLSFRISPTSHSDLLNGDEPVSTLTQDFHTRLDNLLRTLVHARPHFVRCIRSNATETAGCFERRVVVQQIRALQVLETVNLMASGFPHRMRFKQFNARYRMLAPFRLLRRIEDKAQEDSNLILEYAMENPPTVDGSVTLAWAPGKRHVFLSEGIRQHLEHLRSEIRNKSATLIQATWRGWQLRKKMGTVKKSRLIADSLTTTAMNNKANKVHSNSMPLQASTISRLTKSSNLNTMTTRPRPQPIAGTPPPIQTDSNEKCDSKIIQQTCSMFGLDLERPPPVPPSRCYTIAGNTKISYPQSRIMKINFPEDAATSPVSSMCGAEKLKKGETVNVVGASTCRGHLIVEHNGQNFHVPFQYMELLRGNNSNNKNNTATNNNNNVISANLNANNGGGGGINANINSSVNI